MLSVLEHLFRFAEVYTVILAWTAVPLGFLACYMFFQRHYSMFTPTRSEARVRKQERK